MSRWRERLQAFAGARRNRRSRGHAPSWASLDTAPAEGSGPPQSVLADVDSAQLCALWRKSAAGLSGATDVEQHLAVVEARGALLAELERRDPAPMAAWLATGGPGEPAGPASYLVGADQLPGRGADRHAPDQQETRER